MMVWLDENIEDCRFSGFQYVLEHVSTVAGPGAKRSHLWRLWSVRGSPALLLSVSGSHEL